MSETIGERSKRAINDPREREAVVLLASAGWSRGELAMCFNVSESAVGRLLESTTPVGAVQ